MSGPQTTTASFTSPAAIIAPDILAQQQQIARQQALAQALREQSLQDNQGNGGRVSWTQGLARLADAWASKKLNAKADAATTDVARQYAAGLRGLFGGGSSPSNNPGTPMSADSNTQPAPAPGNTALAAGVRQAAGIPDPSDPSRGVYGSGGIDDPGTLDPSPPVSASAPAEAPAAAVSSSPSPQMAPTSGPMSLTGNPGQDMMMYSLNPDEYTKAVITAHAPVDMAKNVQQAQEAMARGDVATASALLASINKQNYIAPLDGRPGTVVRDPMNPSRVLAVNPQNIEGANPVIGPDGQWTGGYASAPGAAGAIGAVAAAKARGGATGDLVQRFNPQSQQMEWVPKATMLPGGGLTGMFDGRGGGASGGQAGAGNAAAPPLGAPQAGGQAGQNSANQFNAIIGGAQGSQDRAFTLGKIADIAKGLPTGAGATEINTLKSGVNSVLGAVGVGPVFSNDQVSRVQEIQKLASQLAQQQAAALGGGNGATDARLSAAFASLPDASKAPQAIRDITTYLQGNEKAIQGRAQAAAAWQAQHGPGDFTSFASAWQKAYDPRIYQWMAAGPQSVRQNLAKLPPAERNALIAKSNQLHAMGAL